MSTFDLKPLSPESIEEMNFNNDNLWLVELSGTEYGPFETESLKHYASENKEILLEALARRLDQEEFKDFWAYPQFQRRKMQVINTAEDQGQYWIMFQGLKAGPLSFKEVDKQIEMNLLSMTDLVSIDSGENWLKIFQITSFDRRSHHPNDLPNSPLESNFQAARLKVIDELETKIPKVSSELTDLVYELKHQAKVIPFPAEAMEARVSALEHKTQKRWIIPAAVAVLGVIFFNGDFSSEISSPDIARTPSASSSAMAKRNIGPRHKGYSPPSLSDRSPASIRPQAPSIERIENSPRYPTIIETHEEDYGNNLDYPQERPDEPYVEGESGPKEYSLVGNDTYAPQSLDAAMSGDVNEAIVEEVSDF